MSDARLVYFSSATENTKRFVEKLSFEAHRIPLRRNDEELFVSHPYILVVPTYGGGEHKGAVPKQVIKFLNVPENRNLCIGVVSSGNTNFGSGYLLAGKILEQKLAVPFLYGFELLGTDEDVEKVQKGIEENWDNLLARRGFAS